MAKAVTLKNNNNEEVYPVTDLSLVNGNIPTGRIADNAVTSAKIANKAVTSDKIDWTTLGYKHIRSSTEVSVGTSTTTLLSFQLAAGTWLLIGTSDFNHKNTIIGDTFIGFQNLTSNKRIGSEFYFHEVNDGTYWTIETVHEVVTLTGTANIGLVAKRSQGDLSSKRKSFTAIRIG